MKYDKKENFSYAIGMFASMELIDAMPNVVTRVFYSSKIKDNELTKKFFNTVKKLNIPIQESDKIVEQISKKENVFVVAEFKKFTSKIYGGNTLVLVNPSDMGNMGTILRTALGFNIKNIAIIKPCVDIFDPKVVRASQGALFKLNIQMFDSFDEYLKTDENQKYLFCLDGKEYLQNLNAKKKPFSLIFGNEASGLPKDIYSCGETIKIKQSENIDSFNLAISVALACYEFTK